MGKNKNTTKPLTEEEIWDDSALVRTWDEAVEEYQLYHSIHAKGENVEDVLREADATESGESGLVEEQQMKTDGESPVVVPTAVPVEAGPVQETTEPQTQPSGECPIPPPDPGMGTDSAATGAASMPMPHPAMASVQDEGLKNLVMSWYFAGYYTGLYEGQQKAQSGTR